MVRHELERCERKRCRWQAKTQLKKKGGKRHSKREGRERKRKERKAGS